MSQVPPDSGSFVPYAQPVEHQKTDVVSIIALVMGILGLILPLVNLVAIVLGAIGIRRTSLPAVGGKGLAISGLVLGIAGVLLNCMAISVLLPALNRVRETANRAKCASNMSMIAKSAIIYSIENRNNMPPDLMTISKSGSLPGAVFCCPSSSDTPGLMSFSTDPAARAAGELSYVWVGAKLRNNAPAEQALLIEPLLNHDGDGSNVLFADGHCEFVPASDVRKLVNVAKAKMQIDDATAKAILSVK